MVMLHGRMVGIHNDGLRPSLMLGGVKGLELREFSSNDFRYSLNSTLQFEVLGGQVFQPQRGSACQDAVNAAEVETHQNSHPKTLQLPQEAQILLSLLEGAGLVGAPCQRSGWSGT